MGITTEGASAALSRTECLEFSHKDGSRGREFGRRCQAGYPAVRWEGGLSPKRRRRLRPRASTDCGPRWWVIRFGHEPSFVCTHTQTFGRLLRSVSDLSAGTIFESGHGWVRLRQCVL